MTGRVTRRPSLAMLYEHAEAGIQRWLWLIEAADRAVDAWLIRPRIGDSRPHPTMPVFRPRDHFRMDGQPKEKLTETRARLRASLTPELQPYQCSVCLEWHTGHPRQTQIESRI